MWSATRRHRKFINSIFSSSNFSIRVVRAYSLTDIRQTVPWRAHLGKSSDSRQQHLSQQCHPPFCNNNDKNDNNTDDDNNDINNNPSYTGLRGDWAKHRRRDGLRLSDLDPGRRRTLYIYIYIYIERERERDYMHIRAYTHTHIHIVIITFIISIV